MNRFIRGDYSPYRVTLSHVYALLRRYSANDRPRPVPCTHSSTKMRGCHCDKLLNAISLDIVEEYINANIMRGNIITFNKFIRNRPDLRRYSTVYDREQAFLFITQYKLDNIHPLIN